MNPENAWFVGYAPWEDPEICVAVMLIGAGHGGDEAGREQAILDVRLVHRRGRQGAEGPAGRRSHPAPSTCWSILTLRSELQA